MTSNTTFESGINYSKYLSWDYTPISVCANFDTLEYPNWLNSFVKTDVDIAGFDAPESPNWLNNF